VRRALGVIGNQRLGSMFPTVRVPDRDGRDTSKNTRVSAPRIGTRFGIVTVNP